MKVNVKIVGMKEKFGDKAINTRAITGLQIRHLDGHDITNIHLGDHTVASFASVQDILKSFPDDAFTTDQNQMSVTVTDNEGHNLFFGNYREFLENEHYTAE